MMLIHMQTDVDLLIKQLLLSHATEKEQQFLMNCKSRLGIYLYSVYNSVYIFPYIFRYVFLYIPLYRSLYDDLSPSVSL